MLQLKFSASHYLSQGDYRNRLEDMSAPDEMDVIEGMTAPEIAVSGSPSGQKIIIGAKLLSKRIPGLSKT